MKNLFKKLMTQGNNKDEEDEYLNRALVPVMTALGAREKALAILECGNTKHDIWGILIGIHIKSLTARQRARVKQLVDELKTFSDCP